MRDSTKRQIEILINEVEQELVESTLSVSNYEKEIEKKCLEISLKITVSSKGIMSSLFTELSEETLEKDIFKKAENMNEFYRLDLAFEIYNKYNFDPNYKINFNGSNSQFIASGIAIGTTSMGTALSLSLTQKIIIPIALVVGVCLYRVIKKYVDDKNRKEYINKYIQRLRCELLQWFDNIESYYNEEVNKLIKSLEG